MTDPLLLALVPLLVVASALGGYYYWTYRRNAALGTPGIVSRSRLTCSHCHQTFDYDFLPGASLTAVRLGSSRYMACPICRRWGVFSLLGNRQPVGEARSP